MSTNAVTPIQKTQLEDFSKEQLDLITRTIAKGATPDELKLFLYRCKQLGLDPLKPGQIHFIKYGQGPGSIVVGIEGFRAKAVRTGKLSGIKRGAIRDDKGKCVGAWAEVYRSDWQHPAREEVPLSEYDTGRGVWTDMPETMIKKVAEAAALRMAFPDDLGGVYEKAEMDQAEKKGGRVLPQAPEEGDGIVHEGYRVPGHLDSRLAGKTIDRCDPEVLREVVLSLESKYQKLGKPIPGKGQEFIAEAEKVIAAWENAQPVSESDSEWENA